MRFGTTEGATPKPHFLYCKLLIRLVGEGGTFALYKSIFPAEEILDDDRTLTGDSTDRTPSVPSSNRSKVQRAFQWPLLVWVSLSP